MTYLCRYHHIYCDNFFSSVTLFLDLLRHGLYACGTLRQNRKGFPEDLKPFVKKGFKERGDSIIRQRENISVTVWQDNRTVSFLSTNCNPTTPGSVNRKNKDGTTRIVPCPEAAQHYNKYMGGVDLNDQLRGYYSLRMKCRKYYKYIFWFLVDLAITNTYILCKNHTHLNILSTKTFRFELAKSLIGSYSSRKRPGRPSLTPIPKRFKVADHFPCKRVEKGEKKGHKCCHCRAQYDRRRETVWHCNTCNKFLCHTGREDNCFLEYHQFHI